jgi:hypothetical protein
MLAVLSSIGAAVSREPLLDARPTGSRRRLGVSLAGRLALTDVNVETPDVGWFDGATVGACTVQRLPSSASTDPAWLMWYAGRAEGFASDVMPIATGAIGLAVSHDGLTWELACGTGDAGECLGPSDDPGAFDATHIGVGDVLGTGGSAMRMLYFGGGEAAKDLGGGRTVRGVHMGISVATSSDAGLHWERGGTALLEPQEGALFVGWPCAFGEHVYYHACDVSRHGGKFVIGRTCLWRSNRYLELSSRRARRRGALTRHVRRGAWHAHVQARAGRARVASVACAW